MTMLSEFLYLLLRWFKPSVNIYIIVLDFTPGAKNNSRLLKRINNSNGLIVLADNALFSNNNKACLPGVVPADTKVYPLINKPIKKKFLLSGEMVEQISQISKVLKVFSALPQCELHISGNIDNIEIIAPYKECKNIIYHGKVKWEEYLDLLHSCPFTLSTRDINALENQCNFPSKIIESLLHNRIIISTFLYEQLKEINILHVRNEIYEMENDIANIAAMSDDELLIYANQADKTKCYFGVDVWKSTIEQIETKNKIK